MTWLKRMFAATLLAGSLCLAAGCGGGACTDACNKLKDCLGMAGECSGDCSGNAKCVAECTNKSSCDDIKAGMGGTQNTYTECVLKCQ